MDHPQDSEPPKTPPNKFPTPSTPPTPRGKSPRGKSPRVRASYDCGNRDKLGPSYWEYHDKTPNFAVSPLTGGDFKEHLTLVEWADKLGYKLPSGESALAGRPDPSELKPGAKLPSTIAGIDRLLKKGDGVSRVLSGSPAISEASLAPQAVLYSGGGRQKETDQEDSKPSLEKSSKPKLQFGAMLPPPPRVLGGLAKISDQVPKPSSEDSNKAKPEAVAMPQRLLKGAARLQEMADVANPRQAEENRAKVFMDRLPKVQEASRRLQGQLGIHCDETWPLPRLPSEPNPFIVGINAGKIHLALENCKDFAVTTNRESDKLEFLDVVMKHHEKRVVPQAGQVPKIRLNSFEEEKKASEAEASNAITRMMTEGLEEGLKEMEDEGMSKGMSDVPSTPKSLFHSVGPTPTPSAQLSQGSNADASGEEESLSASQEGSSVDTAERERREELAELMRNPRFRGTDPYGVHEFDPSPTPESADRSDDPFATPRWLYDENATPPPYDSRGNSLRYNTTTDSYDDQEMRTPSHQTQSASAASEHDPTAVVPPSQELGALSGHDSELEATQSMMDETVAVLNAQDKGKGREGSLGVGEMTSDGLQDQDRGRVSETSSSVGGNGSFPSQDRQKGKGKQTISDFGNVHIHNGKEHHGQTGSGSRDIEVDVAASLRNHSVTFLDESQPKVKERHPVVPQPEKMHGSLTEAICNYMPLEAKPILTLTLERIDPPTASPTTRRCILLKHFEIGLDGVEGLCQGTAKIPETPEVTAEREARVGKIGTWKQGDGGFYRSLKSAQQKDQQYGKGYWYFFGVRFKQVGRERRLRRGGKWLLFGAPIEAVYHLDVKRSQENVTVQLGGGVDASGNAVRSFEANFKRTHTLFSRGGIAPMDVWQGGENWDDGVIRDIKAAMANNGLRVGFLYANSQTFTPYPESFPAAGKNQAEKKRKESGPAMTDEEMKAMAKSMKPKRLSEEAIGAILAMKVINDSAKQDAAAGSK